MNSNDRANLIKRINTLEGLTDKERSALLGLLRENKTYGLVWEDKPEDVEERLRDELPILTEVPERAIISEDKDAPNHILIEGDNLEALATLAYTHEGKIDVIYIDPPYNTGNKDFIYNDSYVDKEDSYRHSKWLSFMSRRLKIAKRLLSERGVIFISIDDNELAQLKLLCDDIFGESNFINNISINMNSLSGVKMTHSINGKRYPAQKESLLLYRKSSLPLSLLIEKTHKEKWDKEYNLIIPEMKTGDFEAFDSMNIDEVNLYLSKCQLKSIHSYAKENNIDLCEEWLWDNAYRIFGTKSNRPLAKRNVNLFFNQQIICYLNNDGNKRFFRSDYNKTTKDPRIELVRAESNSSIFLSDNWIDISNDGGVAQEGGVTYPNGKKPLSLITRIIKAYNMPNCTVLDFFAGSGTTLHATLVLNSKDNGKRKCILVQNKENKMNICSKVTYIRAKNIINGYNEVVPFANNNLRYYRTGFVGRSRSMQNMRKLVNLATDMLCIKEDLYTEQNTFGGQKTYKGIFRYFDDGKKQMLVIYREEAIDELVDIIYEMDITQPIKVYVFSPSEDPWEGSFDDVSDKVELCALPQAIYNTYRRILPKKKDAVVMPEEDALASTQEDKDLFEGMLNFTDEEEA